jgi:hypothetical protein
MDELDTPSDLGPENEQQLERLRRTLILGNGFQLVLLEVSQPDLGAEVLRRLLLWSGHDGVPALMAVKTRPGRDPIAALRGIPAGVILVGIDHPFDVDRVEQSMTTLNWHRDELPLLVPGPLVVMLSPDGLRRLFVHAPDLLSWRAHTSRVTTPRPFDLEVRPRPGRRASLEEKAWLEKTIDALDDADLIEDRLGTPAFWDLLIKLGEIEAREGGPWEQRFERAEQIAGADRDVRFRIELARVRHALDEDRYEHARLHEAAAAEFLEHRDRFDRVPDDVELAKLGVVRAERLLRTGEVDPAVEVADTALRSARTSGDSALLIAALGVRAAVARHRGDHAEAVSLYAELHAAARAALDPAAEVFALIRLVELAPGLEHARSLYLQAMLLVQDEDHEVRAHACLALARQELLAGHPDEAERTLSRVTSLTELQPRTRMRVLVARGKVATARRQDGDALMAYRTAWDELGRTDLLSRRHARIGLLLGDAALRAGDATLARDAYRRVAEIAEGLTDHQLAAAAQAGQERVQSALTPASPGDRAE